MSFFGFETDDPDNGRRQFLDDGPLDDRSDIPVYTWGADNYDTLGDALQEGGDDLNDETFGGSGPVGGCSSFRLCSRLILCREGF
jgi:DNA topoisomerase 2-associated protein PAT1